ncbi:MAG: EamA family transporter [Alphaproteobacteria bacterium]|nr:EamA family transporter [Alphaproteobacteria bacterium]
MELSLVAIVILTGLMHATWNAVIKGGPDNWVSAGLVMGTGAVIAIAAVPFLALPSAAAWPWLVYTGIVHTAYQAVLVYAYRLGDLGRVYPIARGTAPVVITLVSVPLLSEGLNVTAYLGIAVIVVGLMSLVLEPARHLDLHRKSLFFALLTGLSIATYSMIDAVGIRIAIAAGDAPLTYIMWVFIMGSAPFSFYILWARRRDLGLYRSRHGIISLAAGLIAIAGYSLVLWTYTQGAVAPIAALRESGVIFAALIGSFLFGEGRWRQRGLAAGLFFIGAVTLQL